MNQPLCPAQSWLSLHLAFSPANNPLRLLLAVPPGSTLPCNSHDHPPPVMHAATLHLPAQRPSSSLDPVATDSQQPSLTPVTDLLPCELSLTGHSLYSASGQPEF
ncbi:hypothetical protein AAC387_Pa05g1063 [Persea americana]